MMTFKNKLRCISGLVFAAGALAAVECSTALAVEPANPVPSVEFYVSPAGSDANPGTREKPFGTLEKARDAARQAQGRKVVTLAAGVYRIAKTFELNERDTSVTFRALPGAEARLSGGVAVPASAVKPVTDAAVLDRLLPEVRGKVLEVDLKALGVQDTGAIGPRGFRRPYIPAPLELFVDDEPLTLAQWPNPGQPGEPIGKVLDKGSVTRHGKKPERGGVFEFKTDRLARWTKAGDIWITGLFNNGYADNTVRIKAFDLEKHTITTEQPHMYGFASGQPWQCWTALNLLEEIDLPGEFMADKASGKLYFLPPANKKIASCRLEVSVLTAPMAAVEGASGVVFDGLIFENARGMGIYIERGANNRVQNCVLRNFGMVAVSVGKGVSPDPDYQHGFTGKPVSRALGSWHEHIYNNTAYNREGGKGHGIVNCRIYNIGAGAVSLGGGDRLKLEPAGNFVEGCDIHHFNRWDRSYKAAVNIDGVGNVIRRNHLHHCPASAIYLHGNDHLIEYNEIDHAMSEGDDMGAFYMGRDPSERGNVIRYNYWHDMWADHRTLCLYFDDGGGEGTKVYGNVFWRAAKNLVVFINGGSDITVENNIFVDCGKPIAVARFMQGQFNLLKGRMEQVSFNKPPWSEHYPDAVNYLERTKRPDNNHLERNLVTKCGDARFVDGAKGNFTLKPGADTGIPNFQPIPFNKIGLP